MKLVYVQNELPTDQSVCLYGLQHNLILYPPPTNHPLQIHSSFYLGLSGRKLRLGKNAAFVGCVAGGYNCTTSRAIIIVIVSVSDGCADWRTGGGRQKRF